MATKIRMSKNLSLVNINEVIRSIKGIHGNHEIAIWEVLSTGDSSDSETEVDAPDSVYDGSVPEVAEIVCKTKTNSIGSEYITWVADDGDGTTTTHYFWWSKPEISTVTCIAKADCTAETTFHFHAGDDSEFYVWINKAGTDSDPTETGTAIEADISGDTTAAQVATTVAAAIDANANFGAASSDEVVTITNAANGDATDINETEGEATGFTLAVSEQGGSDPSATGTGHEVDISADTTAANVADQLATDMNSVANITASATDATVTVENDNHTASITDCSDSGSAVSSITIINQGTAEYGAGYLYVTSSSANDNDATAGHVRTVTILGFDGNDDPIADIVSMSGTSYVKTSNQFSRVIHMYASDFGTGGTDAAGNIILVDANTGNGTTYLTIAANGTESNGAALHIGSGNYAYIDDFSLVQTTNANTGETMALLYLTGFEDYLNTDSDFDYLKLVVDNYQIKSYPFTSKIPRTGSDTAVITPKEREVGTNGNESYILSYRVITWQ